MAQSENKKSNEFTYPLVTAEKFVRLFEHVPHPNQEQQATLAAAYYTLSIQKNSSYNRSKMHINAAIALLKNIAPEHRKENWSSQIAHAYFKRAELLEENQNYPAAIVEYKSCLQALQNNVETLSFANDEEFDQYIPVETEASLTNESRLLFAQAAISIADLMINEEDINPDEEAVHPLFYINLALDKLNGLTVKDEDVYATQAYAHQIAGIAFGPEHFDYAKDAFNAALCMAFKTDTMKICPLLADIYSCLGLLYEQSHSRCVVEKLDDNALDHAMIYFGISLLFTPDEMFDPDEEESQVLEALFEMIYRVLDPYLPSLSVRLSCDLIDSLIFAYMCIVDKSLPNKLLEQQFIQSETLDIFAQHIYWLVQEAYQKLHCRSRSLEIVYPDSLDSSLQITDILPVVQNNHKSKVLYFDKRRDAAPPLSI